MTNWDCPECAKLCKDAKEHVTHIIDKHMFENLVKSPSRPKKKQRQQSPGKDGDFDPKMEVCNETTFICPYPGCDHHEKRYKKKQHLKRHYINHFPCDGPEDPGCWHCYAKLDDLGALTRHMEKWCSEKKEKKGEGEEEEASAIQKQWMQRFDEMKQEATRQLDDTLHGELKQKSKRTRTEQKETVSDETPKRGSKKPRTEQANANLNMTMNRKLKGAGILQKEALEDRGSRRDEFGVGVGEYETNKTDETLEEIEMSRHEPTGSVLKSNMELIAGRGFSDGTSAVAFATAGQIQDLGSRCTEPIPLHNNALMESVSTAPAAPDLYAQPQTTPSFPYSEEALFEDFEEWWKFNETVYYPYLDVGVLNGDGGTTG